jgi:hypothetical protein
MGCAAGDPVFLEEYPNKELIIVMMAKNRLTISARR